MTQSAAKGKQPMDRRVIALLAKTEVERHAYRLAKTGSGRGAGLQDFRKECTGTRRIIPL